MNVVVIIHQSGLELDSPDNVTTEVVGVYKNTKEAMLAFNGYLDALEAAWREEESPVIAFNRFSEKTGNILTYANCTNHRTKHSVWAVEEEVQ